MSARDGWRYGVLCALLCLAAALSLHFWLSGPPPSPRLDLSTRLPLRVGAWRGKEVPLSPGARALLGAGNVLYREYRRPGRPPLLLCLTLSTGSHRVTHAPEVCYEGQGWNVIGKEERTLLVPGTPPRRLAVEHFQVSGPDRVLEVVVWYRTSAGETTSYLRQKLDMLFGRLFGGHRWSAMIRLSLPAAGDREGAEAALSVVGEFCADLLPLLDRLFEGIEP